MALDIGRLGSRQEQNYNSDAGRLLCPKVNPEFPCGSELARDSGLTANTWCGYTGLIASKLAPTGFLSPMSLGWRLQ
ncbi:hypothetical protein F7R20_10535 [Pseudomonas brassicacearum subsp. brassicacearum]|nr:hypothetical protein F7R20_10535 [Pseudomonas brassicacearum subsp. brassicacearum]QEO80820.1 hypothetical protein ELZ14_25950 [Pseudomonas brassicacearum]